MSGGTPTMGAKRRIRLGEMLVQHGAISDTQLEAALVAQRRTGRKLGRVLADLGFMSESSLLEFLSKHLQVPVVDLKHAKVDQETVKLLAEPLARRYRAIVLLKDARGLLIGMADPSDLHAYDELQAKLRQPLRLALVGEAELLKTLDAVYRQTDEIASLAEAVRDDLRANDVDIEQLSAEESSPDAPVIKLLQTMFNDAVQARASDIHIEPGEQKLRIRLRVDGVLQEQVIDGRRVASALVTRLKLMSGLDISEKRLPQDGRFSVRVREAAVDVRLATMPTAYGESVVMRLLSQSSALLSLERLGMPAIAEQRFKRLVERTSGMVLVTGPTGSGKTTTLYAALNHINRPGVKVITVEDPVEYRLDRITQVQVMPKIGLDFARVLRTALRQDPDILLIGEMRDRETVEIGLRGAMTGHFVFSTLHTINAIASVNRLLDMGAPGYMIAAALHGVIAQRLVKRVCTDCAQPTMPTANELAWLAACRPDLKPEDQHFLAGAGCTYCNLTGYRGRIAVYEILEIDRTLADAVRRGDLEGFAQAARSRGDYVPLAQGAIDFALSGVTSLGEAMAVGSGLEEFVEIDEPARRREAEVQLEDDAALEDTGVDALLERRV
jgi:MSHA biogenesis protein MshE